MTVSRKERPTKETYTEMGVPMHTLSKTYVLAVIDAINPFLYKYLR